MVFRISRLVIPTFEDASVKNLYHHRRPSHEGRASAPSRLTASVPVTRHDIAGRSPKLLRTVQHRPAGAGSSGEPRWEQAWAVSQVGRKPGEIRSAKDVCFRNNGQIIICEDRNARLQFFDQRGISIAVVDREHDPGLLAPTGVCETSGGRHLLVADMNQVHIFNRRGECRDYRVLDKTNLHGICVTRAGHMILTDVGTKPSVAIHATDGKVIRRLKGDFGRPYYVTADDLYGAICVSDSENHVIHMFDINGHPICKFGNHRDPGKRLVWPSGLCFDQRGQIFVADRACDVIVSYDLRGKFKEQILSRVNDVKNPVALTINGRHQMAITEEWHDFKIDSYSLKLLERC